MSTNFIIRDIEIYNKTKDSQYYELTAYIERQHSYVVRVDIYPKINKKLKTSFESYLINEEDILYNNDIKCEIMDYEWNEIVKQTKKQFQIEL